MKTYRVEWVIDLDAESPEEAATIALKIQRDRDSLATCFEVYDADDSPLLEGFDAQEYEYDKRWRWQVV